MTKVLNGLDRILSEPELLSKLKTANVGLLVNPTSVTRDLTHAVDALVGAGVNIVRLFGPEHGVRGEAQDMEAVDERFDPITGIETVSLYGHTLESLTPPPESFEGIDLLLCDIQDIGSRYYTYIYTVGLAMHAASKAGVSTWVLDRPNPIRGDVVAGNVLMDEYKSFVGLQSIAVRHGMTMGECAEFFRQFGGWDADISVIKMEGWSRDLWFDQTDLPWVLPSPNMPTLETAVVYPGQCILEGTTISEGRGTTRPFELFGAPYIDAVALKQDLNALKLPGVAFREVSFRPKFQKHGDETCGGLQVHVTDRDAYDSIAMTYAIISILLKRYPEQFAWRAEAYEFVADRMAIDLLIGDPVLRIGLEQGDDPVALANTNGNRRSEFDERRDSVLLYR